MNQKIIKNLIILFLLVAYSMVLPMQEQGVLQEVPQEEALPQGVLQDRRVSAGRTSLLSCIHQRQISGDNSCLQDSTEQWIDDALATLSKEKFEAIVNSLAVTTAVRAFFDSSTKPLLKKSSEISRALESVFSMESLSFSIQEKFLFRVSTQGFNLYSLIYKAALCQVSDSDRLILIHILIAAYEPLQVHNIIKAIKACLDGDLETLKRLPLGQMNHALILDEQCNIGLMMAQRTAGFGLLEEIEFSGEFLAYMYCRFLENCSINLINVHGDSLLMIAARNQYAVIIEALFYREELELNAQNNSGDTAFSIAVSKNFIEGVRLFLQRDDLDQLLGRVFSPAIMAEVYGFSEIASLLNAWRGSSSLETPPEAESDSEYDSGSDMDISTTDDE